MLITVYADQTPPNYTLLVNCLPDGSQAKRTLTCSASPDNGSPAGSLGYNWFAGGAPVGGCSGATCTISGVGFGQTQVQVQAMLEAGAYRERAGGVWYAVRYGCCCVAHPLGQRNSGKGGGRGDWCCLAALTRTHPLKHDLQAHSLCVIVERLFDH